MIIGLIFQFCGSILLVWTAVAKKARDIDDEFKTKTKPLITPLKIIKERLFEQHLNVVGFGLFVVGFLPMLVIIDWSYYILLETIINKYLLYKLAAIVSLLLICVTIALIWSSIISKNRHKRINSKLQVPGQIWAVDI